MGHCTAQPMPVLVDANNILHVTGVLPPDIAGVDEEGLAQLIADSRYRGDAVCLVCDGPRRNRPTGPIAGISLRYSGAGKTADEVIAHLVAQCTAPRRLTVVSGDRAILRDARKRRCPVLTASEFLETLTRDHAARGKLGTAPRSRPPTPTLDSQSIDAWRSFFGLDDPQALERLARAAREGPAHKRPHDRRTPRAL
ncbi:MAG: hypothetical protein FJ285_04450 [Planctomycetes bacterium]|nr:hypothetical protein [Planctomycetota bacterium]